MKVIDNFNLLNYNSYRLSSICSKAFFPETEEDFRTIYKQYSREKIILLGGGYNIILSKQFYEESFIILNGNFSSVSLEGNIIEVEAGADMRDISVFAKNNGLSGIEVFYDIPGSLGGAVVMNAGASGEEIKDVILRLRYLDLEDLTIKEFENDAINFEYRNSIFQRNASKIVLRAWLKLNAGNVDVIWQKMEAIKGLRWSKQPKDFPNAGSVFKRPPGRFVGPMIEELGLKGYCMGGAKISEKHAGFIVNYKQATGQDIIKLIEFIKESVLTKFGVELEVEQRII